MMTIELDRCDGCGDCVEVCPEGAISLVDGVARIDSGSCTECEVCVQACPSGAIKVARPIAVREEPAVALAESRRPSTLATLGTALGLIGSRLLPRLADAIVGALDRRLSGQPASESRSEPISPESGTGEQRGGSHRRRRRRGR